VRVSGGDRLTVSFEVRNAGERAGADSPQVYLVSAAGKPVLRLIGFERVHLDPGERRRVTITADLRLLGGFDERHARWRVDGGTYRVLVGKSAGDLQTGGETVIAAYHGK
jgi:beta-glucosidase